jgi:hypothetical protein
MLSADHLPQDPGKHAPYLLRHSPQRLTSVIVVKKKKESDAEQRYHRRQVEVHHRPEEAQSRTCVCGTKTRQERDRNRVAHLNGPHDARGHMDYLLLPEHKALAILLLYRNLQSIVNHHGKNLASLPCVKNWVTVWLLDRWSRVP